MMSAIIIMHPYCSWQSQPTETATNNICLNANHQTPHPPTASTIHPHLGHDRRKHTSMMVHKSLLAHATQPDQFILVRSIQRKSKESSLQARERITRRAMEVLKLTSMLRRLIIESRYLIEFKVNAANPYFSGEMYWIQPIQSGMLPEFLKKPENRTKGSKRMGTTAETDLASVMRLPRSRPSELPQRLIRKMMEQKMKNWRALLDSLIIQQKMRLNSSGITTRQGTSIAFLLRKYAPTEYSREFSSFRKTMRSMGNTTVMGTIAVVSEVMHTKNSSPVTECQLAVTVRLFCPNQKYKPPTYIPRITVCSSLARNRRGFLTIFKKSLFIRVLKVVPTGISFQYFLSPVFSTLWISVRTKGAQWSWQNLKYQGYLLRLQGFQGWMTWSQNQAGFWQGPQERLKLSLKQSTAWSAGPWYTNCPSAIKNSRSNLQQISVLGW